MAKNIELYDKTKTYYFPAGRAATPEVVALEYPMFLVVPVVITTDPSGKIMKSYELLSDLREQHGIPDDTTDEEALEILKAKE